MFLVNRHSEAFFLIMMFYLKHVLADGRDAVISNVCFDIRYRKCIFNLVPGKNCFMPLYVHLNLLSIRSFKKWKDFE